MSNPLLRRTSTARNKPKNKENKRAHEESRFAETTMSKPMSTVVRNAVKSLTCLSQWTRHQNQRDSRSCGFITNAVKLFCITTRKVRPIVPRWQDSGSAASPTAIIEEERFGNRKSFSIPSTGTSRTITHPTGCNASKILVDLWREV